MTLKGTYCLCIENKKEKKITIGALGNLQFPTGKYIYVGSALNSLKPRLERHIKTSKGKHHITHWHIDYLLKDTDVEIQSIFIIINNERIECEMVNKVSQNGEAIPRFGSSDCNCPSHLFRVKDNNFLRKIGFNKLELKTFFNFFN